LDLARIEFPIDGALAFNRASRGSSTPLTSLNVPPMSTSPSASSASA